MNLRIKDILKEKNVSSKELSTMINLAAPNVSNLINGKSKPSIEVFEKISHALNVPITDLFERPASDTITCPNCGAKFQMKK